MSACGLPSQEIWFCYQSKRFPLRDIIFALGTPDPLLTNLDQDYSKICSNLYAHMIRAHFTSSKEPIALINWDLYDVSPYQLLLDLILEAKKYLTHKTIVDVLTGKNDNRALKGRECYIHLETGIKLPMETINLWRFVNSAYKIASCHPLIGPYIQSCTGFSSVEHIETALARIQSNPDRVMYYNIEKDKMSRQNTWSKLHHSAEYKFCTSSKNKLEYLNTLLSKMVIAQESGPKTPTKRKAIPKSVREDIWRRDCGEMLMVGSCFCCGTQVRHENFEAGHVISVAHGGGYDVSNLRVVCKSCNRSMGTMNMREFCQTYYRSRKIIF